MSKKWLLVPTIVFVALVGWLLFRSAPVSPISPQNYERIQLGMTFDEVEAIIGLPPGDYYSPPQPPMGSMIKSSGRPVNSFVIASFDQREPPEPLITVEWWGERYLIVVMCDGKEKVIGYYLWEMNRPVGWIERVQAWLGI